MARAVALAGIIALAAGQGLAVPIETTTQMGEWAEAAAEAQRAAAASVDETINQTEGLTSGVSRMMGTQEPAQQHAVQEAVLDAIMKEVQTIFKNTLTVPGWENMDSAAETVKQIVERVRERLNTTFAETEGRSTMTTAAALRGVTNDFLKEIMVQEAVIETLWAVLRDSQARPWITNEQQAMHTAATQAVHGFLTRMQDRLRATGFTDEEIMKMMPRTKTCVREGPNGVYDACAERNLGKRGGYGGYGGYYGGYGGWGYGGWGYGYPSYGYGYGYGGCGYGGCGGWGYGYPMYGGWGYGKKGWWRRLAEATTPETNMPTMNFPTTTLNDNMGYTPATTGVTGMNRPEIVRMNRPEMMGMNRPEMMGMNRTEMMGMNRPEMMGMNRPEMMGMNRPEVMAPQTQATGRMLQWGGGYGHGGYGHGGYYGGGYGHGGYGHGGYYGGGYGHGGYGHGGYYGGGYGYPGYGHGGYYGGGYGYPGYGYGHGHHHHHHWRRLEVPELGVSQASTTLPTDRMTDNTSTSGRSTNFSQGTFRRAGETRTPMTTGSFATQNMGTPMYETMEAVPNTWDSSYN